MLYDRFHHASVPCFFFPEKVDPGDDRAPDRLHGVLRGRFPHGAADTEQDHHGGARDIFRIVAGRRYGPDGGVHPRYTVHR